MKTHFNAEIPFNMKLDIFDNGYNFSYHWGGLYYYFFNELCSSYSVLTCNNIETGKYIEKLKSVYAIDDKQILLTERVFNDYNKLDFNDPEIARFFIIIRHGLAVCSLPDRIVILYNKEQPKEEIIKLARMTEDFKIEVKKLKEFYMVTKSEHNHGFTLKSFNIKEHEINIEDNYNDDFREIHYTITESLSCNNKNGLILLHGIYGAGKTYYIRHLINSINKKFIYLPLHMVDWLTDPDFLPYMAKQENAVIILEDCEDIIMKRSDGNRKAIALSNMLNLSDGLLSDALSLNVICSFNINIKKIDDALLRKGRLIARYEFKELENNKAQKLAEKLGKKKVISRAMTLSDIYNIESVSFENKTENKIGFVYK